MARPSPFDPETERALEVLRRQSSADRDQPEPPKRPVIAPNAAGAAAAELAREMARGCPPPPASMSAAEAIETGDSEAAAVRARLDAASALNQGEGHEQQIASPASRESGPEGRERGGEAGAQTDAAESGEAGGEEGEAPEAPDPHPRRAGAREGADVTPRGRHAPTKAVGVGLMPHRMAAADYSISRHASPKAEPDRVAALPADHPAIVEGRTLYPQSVHDTWGSQRFLVSGKNNPKLGGEFRKGPWNGFPLFHVTLEERATCPRSCLQWATCYGSGMPFARRNDHRDPDFLPALKAEVVTMARQFPKGFVVRLHTLGDFYSVEYVRLWADLLDMLPNLRVFGYTARREDADDEESRTIAKAIRWLTEEAWDIFAIRFSGHDGPQGTIVVTEDDPRQSVIMCPAQKYATHACVTCGLCASAEARDKTIGFLLHGKKLKAAAAAQEASGAAGVSEGPAPRADQPAKSRGRVKPEQAADWKARYEAGETLADIAADGEACIPTIRRALDAAGVVMRPRGTRSVKEKSKEKAPGAGDRLATLREKRIERAKLIEAEAKTASDVIREQRSRISIAASKS